MDDYTYPKLIEQKHCDGFDYEIYSVDDIYWRGIVIMNRGHREYFRDDISAQRLKMALVNYGQQNL